MNWYRTASTLGPRNIAPKKQTLIKQKKLNKVFPLFLLFLLLLLSMINIYVYIANNSFQRCRNSHPASSPGRNEPSLRKQAIWRCWPGGRSLRRRRRRRRRRRSSLFFYSSFFRFVSSWDNCLGDFMLKSLFVVIIVTVVVAVAVYHYDWWMIDTLLLSLFVQTCPYISMGLKI